MLIDHLPEIDRRVLTHHWSSTERLGLLRIVWEIYRCDGRYSPQERTSFERLADDLEEEITAARAMELDRAVESLKPDARKMELVYLWMAEAVLADGRYDESEQDLLDTLSSKYFLSRDRLEQAIRELQLHEIDDVLSRWVSEQA